MYEVIRTIRFKKDVALVKRRGYDIALLENVISTLAEGKQLDRVHKDHSLQGKWTGYRECHITPDWFLVYTIDKSVLVLTFTRTGSHSDIF
jgi:mRNA interferase YafQ